MTARDQLDHALAAMTEDGRQTPCAGSDSWLSESHDERAQAARLCHPCPVLDLCAAVVLEESPVFGTWAGTDLTKSTRKPRKAIA